MVFEMKLLLSRSALSRHRRHFYSYGSFGKINIKVSARKREQVKSDVEMFGYRVTRTIADTQIPTSSKKKLLCEPRLGAES